MRVPTVALLATVIGLEIMSVTTTPAPQRPQKNVAQPAGAQGSPRTLLMEGVQIQAYDGRLRTLQVKAARAYASNKRWGFFQSGMVPTLELEQVVIERMDAEGKPQQEYQPHAVIDWPTKLLHPTYDLRTSSH